MNEQAMNQATPQSRLQPGLRQWWRILSVVAVAVALGGLMQATLLWAAPPAASPAQSNPANGGDDLVIRTGVVVTRPDQKVGTWVISKTSEFSYTVTEATITEGNVEIGMCVEVKAAASDPTVALKIRAKDAKHCNRANDDDDDHEDDDKRSLKHYGLIESRPEGKVGLWVIGGETFSATERTELDIDHGRLAVGACAKVESPVGAPNFAREIESERGYKCHARDGDNQARGLLFGLIEELPAELDNGIWAIGGMRFVVSPTTELITKGGTFSVGVLVKVDFTTNMSDTNIARRIEIKYAHACRGHHDDDDDHDNDRALASHNGRSDGRHRYGYCPGGEGKTIGLIDRRPEGTLLGEWVIGGITYLTDATTRFAPDDDFLAGERVKVEFVVLDNNTRFATKLKETDDDGGISDPSHSLIVGFVDAKPDAFIGEWLINGEVFSVTTDSKLFELGSLFAVGAYVVVEYDIANDERIVIKMVTYVPPGAGDENTVGTLQAVGGAVSAQIAGAGVDTFAQSNEVWTVDGVEYIVSEATQLVDNGGELVAGMTVLVNSYTENGQRYATMIRAQEGGLLIPFAAR